MFHNRYTCTWDRQMSNVGLLDRRKRERHKIDKAWQKTHTACRLCERIS